MWLCFRWISCLSLKDKINADNANVFLVSNEFGESLSFNGVAESNTLSLIGIVNLIAHNTTGNAEAQANPGMATMAEIYVSSDQFSQTPSICDEIIQGSKTWMVLDIIENFGMYKMICSSNRRVKRR